MYAVIMAGGSGTRFWPYSRQLKSKQFLTIVGKKSLIQSTVHRFQSFIKSEDIFIVARIDHKEELEKHDLGIPDKNILFEPLGRNTAPCIGLAALFVQKRDKDGVMVVSPADHLIRGTAGFQKTIKAAHELAKKEESLVTIGIPPNRPAIGYGYIQIDEEAGSYRDVKAYRVKTFAEKPNLATAQRFLQSGDFFWNSGIFIFRASIFLKAIEEHLPELYESLMEIQKCIDRPNYQSILKKMYQQIRSISVDYGIMEKAKNVFLVKGNFVWNDLGSWEQVYKLSPKDKHGNVIKGNVVLIDTKDSYVFSSKGVVSILGLDNVIIVQEGEATLICKLDQAEDVKQIVEQLKAMKLSKYI